MTACVHTYGSIVVRVYLYIYMPLMYPLCTRNCVCEQGVVVSGRVRVVQRIDRR